MVKKYIKDFIVYSSVLLGAMAAGWAVCVVGLWALGVL